MAKNYKARMSMLNIVKNVKHNKIGNLNQKTNVASNTIDFENAAKISCEVTLKYGKFKGEYNIEAENIQDMLKLAKDFLRTNVNYSI